jgi:hypothetical protein
MRSLPVVVLLILTFFSSCSVTNGLIVYYPLNGNVEDKSGNRLHGTLSPHAPVSTTDKKGASNKAYLFNGINYISIPPETLILNEYTYSVWVNSTSLPQWGVAGCVFSLGNPANGKHQAITISNKYASAKLTGWAAGGWNNGSTQTTSVSTDNIPIQDRWYHIVMVRKLNSITMYINNQYVGKSSTDGFLPLYGDNNIAKVGIRCNNVQGFTGKIDEFRIYNRALSEKEIAKLYSKY